MQYGVMNLQKNQNSVSSNCETSFVKQWLLEISFVRHIQEFMEHGNQILKLKLIPTTN
ncbi:unnamed protein product [Brugia timori]|uniref:Bm13080 n=2 Tax=Brugia TaxID=6278 RepID=A0A1I9G1S7_BRUMA|nr:Bm13080 [Brugia malayi]VDO46743.1 unnamed protein product [Brugia timori]